MGIPTKNSYQKKKTSCIVEIPETILEVEEIENKDQIPETILEKTKKEDFEKTKEIKEDWIKELVEMDPNERSFVAASLNVIGGILLLIPYITAVYLLCFSKPPDFPIFHGTPFGIVYYYFFPMIMAFGSMLIIRGDEFYYIDKKRSKCDQDMTILMTYTVIFTSFCILIFTVYYSLIGLATIPLETFFNCICLLFHFFVNCFNFKNSLGVIRAAKFTLNRS